MIRENGLVADAFCTPQFEYVPSSLQDVPAWVVWAFGGDHQRSGKYPKKPYSPRSGNPADATNPKTWGSFWDAQETYHDAKGGFDGVGYVFADDGHHAGVDVDGCRDPESGDLSADAERLLADLDSYTEVSPSGTGVKAIVEGRLDPDGPNRRGGLELYDHGRFFAITGRRVDGCPADVRPAHDTLRRLQASLRPPAVEAVQTGPKKTGDGHELGDGQLLAQMARAANWASIERYLKGDHQGKPSASEALLGLAQHTAFHIGPYPDRLEAFLRTTQLWADAEAERPKWHSSRGSESWGAHYVVLKAIDTCRAFHPSTGHASPYLSSSPTPDQDNTLCKSGVPFSFLERVWKEVAARPVPEFITARVKSQKRTGQRAKRQLATFCMYLALERSGHFYLSSNDAGKLLGVDRATASKWLADFQKPHVGLIRCTMRHDRRSGKANEYQWTGPTV